ncbi:NAD-dependent epimerase/dehydratase family protein [Sphingomonas bacterium]|uniref:NAD-dependent epimerase/dehydratase family protein n=1 Tax=Sphingomonas bacterium TaxID=1895847 RepID=UPI0015753779|nr:NAD-dependent epimerase/dehydratase family protein [Sphingomonas bacterium]
MRRCCIVGGGGFIGVNLANHLVRADWRVTSYGRPPPLGAHDAEVRHVPGEFTDRPALLAAIEGCDAVFHLVGSTPARAEADRVGDVEANVVNTLHLLDAGVAGSFGRIVFVSSGGTVYGSPGQIPIPETAHQWPTCSYGVSKMTIERYLGVYQHLHGLRYGIARVSNPFGPHQRYGTGQGAVAALLHCTLTGEPFTIRGDGTVMRDYFYVEDLAGALAGLAVHEGSGRVFNIGSGVGTSLNALVTLVEGVTGRTIERRHQPGRAIDVPVNVLDVHRAAEELGWRARTPLRIGLARTFDWMSTVGRRGNA